MSIETLKEVLTSPEIEEIKLRAELSRLLGEKTKVLEELAKLDKGPARIDCEDEYAWIQLQQHIDHQCFCKTDGIDVIIECEECNRKLLVISG